MAISLYTGPPGAGKSYALVEQVIVPGVRAGRIVWTNVAGVDPAKVREYVQRKWPECDPGEVRTFEGADSVKEGFFPHPDHPERPSVVPPGALIVIDELGMHWPKGRSTREFPAHLEKFLRMHRHMADAATKQTTDLALSTQHYVDVHTVVRPLCEKTFKFKKLATLGLSKRYVWSMWEGGSAPKGEAVLNGDGKYNPDIFALYKSHSLSDGSGLEAAVDKRATMFGPKFMVGAAVAVVLVLVGAGFMVKLFTPDQVKPKAPGQTGDQVAATGGAVVPAAGAPEPHPDLRIAGMVRTATVNAVVLADKSGRLRLESPSLCFIDRDRPVSCNIDGRSVLPSAATGAVGARPGGNVIFGGAL